LTAEWPGRILGPPLCAPAEPETWRRILGDHRTDTLEDGLAWLVRTYGTAATAALLDVPTAELRAYREGTCAVPALVAGRISYLVLVTDQLVGAYNAMGLRRWWQRPRVALDGRSPRAALGGDWDPAGPAAEAILALARGLNA
jgi:hypothetical protein